MYAVFLRWVWWCVWGLALLSIGAVRGQRLSHTPFAHQQPRSATLPNKKRWRVLSWNVENLYDTLHDEGFDDYDFLPTAQRQWSGARYRYKLSMLARTLIAAGQVQAPDMVGLCEVENAATLHALTRHTRLARLGYDFLVTQSADRRGIDLALLYQPHSFALLSWQALRIDLGKGQRPTRDILHATGRIPTGDTLDVFVVHFPSRRGGIAASEPLRLRAALRLRQAADSIVRRRQRPLLLVMGDFNDQATDRSVSQILAPALQPLSHSAFPYPDKEQSIRGTHFFQGKWSRIDQILVNSPMLTASSPLYTREEYCHIFVAPWLVERNSQGLLQPKRTYLGHFYHGGVSDHLPLLLDLWY